MKKIFLIIFSLLFIAFLAITYQKYAPGSDVEVGRHTATQDSSREQMMKFWENYNQATDYRTDGEFREASGYYRKALEIDSTHSNALYYMGNMQFSFGNYEEAGSYWSQLLEVNSSSARAHIQLGTLYSCRDSLNSIYDPQKAEEHFKKAVQLNPEITGPLLQMAKIDLMNNRLQLAGDKINDVMSTNFRSAEAKFLQGYLAWKKANSKQAETFLEEAIVITRGDDAKYDNIGEGETESADESTETDSSECNLFSSSINNLIYDNIAGHQVNADEVYRNFDREVQEAQPF